MTGIRAGADDPLQEAQQEVERCRQAGDRPGLARALIRLSALLRNAGRLPEAVAAGEEAVSIFRELHSDAELAWALQNVAARYSEAGQHDKSVTAARERCDILRRLGDRSTLAEALITLSAYLQHTAAYAQAVAAAGEGVSIYRELADEPGLAWGLENLANRYSAAGLHEQSVVAGRECCDIHRRRGDRPELARTLIVLSSYESHAAAYAQAVATAEEGVSIYRELADEPDLAWGLENLANRYSAAGLHEQSVVAGRECCDIHRRRGDRPDLARTLVVLSSYLRHLRSFAEAIDTAIDGTGFYRELRSDPGEAWALQNLNSCYAAAPWLRVKRAQVSAPDHEGLQAALAESQVRAVGGVQRDESGTARAEVYATVERLDAVRARGLTVDVVDDNTQYWLDRQKEVGRGNRFADGTAPSGLGVPGGTGLGDLYLNVEEVDTAVRNLAATHGDLCRLIELPERTASEAHRVSHALRLGGGADHSRPTVLLLGGQHAREWGGCEILVNLAADLLQAYRGGTGLRYGGREISPVEVRTVMERLHLLVFPMVNPDGRHHSQYRKGDWRKNRNPAYGVPEVSGVDLNRNYDFLFDLGKHWAPSSEGGEVLGATSADPNEYEVYQGPRPFSEAETLNVKWLLDTHPRVRWQVDVHSYTQVFGYNWNNDDNQITDPGMNFRNPAYDGKRGVTRTFHPDRPLEAVYREYIPAADLGIVQSLTQTFTDGLRAVRGTAYQPEQGVVTYVTAGTVDDYAYARHLVDPGREKVHGFFVEFSTEYVPTWTEMTEVIRDVSSGLFSFCHRAALEAGHIATVTRDPDWMDVFGVGGDGLARVAWWHGRWNDWQPIAGHTFVPHTPITALSRDPDWMDIFAVGADGVARVAWWNGGWNAWQPIYARTFAPGTVIAAQSRNSDQMDLFAIGTDGLVHNAWWHGNWNDWQPIGTQRFTTGAQVTTLTRDPDWMDVFAVGDDGRVYVAWWHGEWNDWQPIYSRTFAPGTAVAGQSRNSDQMDLFAVGTDGLVYNAWWHGNWNDWQPIGTRRFTTGTRLATLTRDPDWMDVFAVGEDGRVYVAWWHGEWNDWQPIGTRTFAPNTPIAAQSRNSDQMDLFAMGTDGLVYNAWWHGRWNDWQSIGSMG
ncbi:M14 family zinc carboxypeptidase [Streptomyces sp. NPDC008240]|uniref:M14 family zinc carboxypeptidase n=1 Tax=Streptomyces sp. NPDC008240 TaxID=3364822 RepID=UPI0036E8F4B6